jgi:hypothetical protein
MTALATTVACLVVAACDGSSSHPSAASSSPPVDQTRWVSPDGHNSWPGTEGQPWRTLAYAFGSLRRGQTLYVHGGTYTEFISKVHIHKGTPSQPIMVKAEPHEGRVVVKGAVFLREPSYWTIDGIDVTADPDQAEVPAALVKLTGGTRWEWRNSEIWGTGSNANVLIAGYGTDEPTRWTFKRNCVHDVEAPGAHRVANLTIGHMGKDAGNGRVVRNLFFDVPGGKNLVVGNGGGGPRGLKIRFNTLYGSRIGVSVAGARRVKFSRNIIAQMSLGFTVRGKKSSTGRIKGHGNVVAQNLAVNTVLSRPGMQKAISGPGNLFSSLVPFDETVDCAGFHTNATVALPYGRYAIG